MQSNLFWFLKITGFIGLYDREDAKVGLPGQFSDIFAQNGNHSTGRTAQAEVYR